MQFGIYYYPWYNQKRWADQPRLRTSVRGEYDSTDPDLVRWQVDLIADCGFDYVILEVVPIEDWGFKTVDRGIELAIECLRRKGMKWSFLLDAFVVQRGEDGARQMSELLRHLETKGWVEGLPPGRTGRPLLFVFFPLPPDADRLREAHGSRYELRFPAYMPHWGKVDDAFDRFSMNPWKACLARVHEKKAVTVFDALVPEGYISFFETTPTRASFDGFASVYPSYEDRHLRRPTAAVPELPVIPPENGTTLRSSFEKALAINPEHVIVYGWNEYFEATTIEPTEEYGYQHVEICKEIIGRTKEAS